MIYTGPGILLGCIFSLSQSFFVSFCVLTDGRGGGMLMLCELLYVLQLIGRWAGWGDLCLMIRPGLGEADTVRAAA
jgi:hypothetical protein